MKFNFQEKHTLGQLESAGLVTLGRGKVISKIDIANTQGDYPVYSSSATGNGEIGRYGRYMFDDERITWSIDGGGRFFYREPHKYSVTNVCGWMKVNSKEINTRYLHLALTFFWQFKEYDYTHKAHPSVIRDEYDRLSFPPLAEQKRIAAELDLITEMIRNREAQLARLDTLVRARFDEMFGDTFSNPKKWRTMTFKGASLRLSDGPFGSNLKSSHYSASGVRVIRLGNIGVGEFINDDQSYISENHYKSLQKYTCRKGELVFGTLGEPNLRACIIPDFINYAVNKSDCVHYIPRPELLDNKFVCFYVNSKGTLRLASSMLHGQTRSRVSSGQIAELPIFVPPLSLQKEFAAVVEEVDKSKVAIKKTIENLKTLYKARLQEHFA